MTKYELSRQQLAEEALSKLVDKVSSYDKLSFAMALSSIADKADDQFELTAQLENLISVYCGLGDLFKTDANFMAASIHANTAYTGYTIQNANEVSAWYKAKRAELEKTKTSEDVEREQARVQAKQGFGQIVHLVRKEFKKWAQKGELEKTVDYKKRIEEKSCAVFDSLCFAESNNLWRSGMTIERMNYDADEEALRISIYYTDNQGEKVTPKNGSLPMPPTAYKNFSMRNINLDESYALSFCIIDNRVIPAVLRLAYGMNYRTHIKDISFANGQKFIISLNDVWDDMPDDFKPSLNGHTFVYDEYASNLVPCAKVYDEIFRLTDKYHDTYHVPLAMKPDGMYGYMWQTYNSELKPKKETYTPSDAEKCVQAFENDCIERVYDYFMVNGLHEIWDILCVQPESLKIIIKNCDLASLDRFLTSSMLEYAIRESPRATYKEYQEQPSKYTVLQIFSLSSPITKFSEHFHPDYESIATAFIENNPTLSKAYASWYKKMTKRSSEQSFGNLNMNSNPHQIFLIKLSEDLYPY